MLTWLSCAHQLTPECPHGASAGYGERSVSRDGPRPHRLAFSAVGGRARRPLPSSTARSPRRRVRLTGRAKCRARSRGGSESAWLRCDARSYGPRGSTGAGEAGWHSSWPPTGTCLRSCALSARRGSQVLLLMSSPELGKACPRRGRGNQPHVNFARSRVRVEGPHPLERPRGREWGSGEISLCTCTGTCTDILPLACTSEISKCSGAGASHQRKEQAAPSGHARSPLSREAHSHARPGEHVDQGVDAEAMEAPPHEIVHARLAHAQELRRPALGEPAARNESLERQHELGPDAEVLGLHGGKPQVAEDVGRALRDLDRHRSLLFPGASPE